jgi:hypothetical protein
MNSELGDLIGDDDAMGDDGLALMTELVAAITWLRRGAMPGLTVWQAIEMAVRDAELLRVDLDEPDPLRQVLLGLFRNHVEPASALLAQSLSRWVGATRDIFNEGLSWA